MKITGNGCEIIKYINEIAPSPGKEETEKPSTQSSTAPESKGDAIVNLSDTAKEVQQAQKVIESEPDIRSKKVLAIKEEVKRGTYEIDYYKTAEKMLGVFIDEMAG
jgi:flagellar biosynthesis anti-sigma factor FlgM